MVLVLGAIVALVLAGGLALQFAISRNGPAVLTAIDRLTGGTHNVALLTEASFGESEAQNLFVWGPENAGDDAAKRPVLLFVHGGSWRSGDPEDYGFMGRAFVPKGFVVVLAGYRMHPDVVYPAMLEDAAGAVAWTKAEIEQFGGDPEQIFVAGHSAGAYNVMMAALEEQWLGARGLATSDIAGVVGLSGPYDFYPFDSDSTINSFGPAEDPEATQPVNHIRGDAPPMLLIHGEADTVVYPRNTRELEKRITAAGGSLQTKFYSEMDHSDPLVSMAAPWRNSRDVDDTIAQFAKEVAAQAKTSVPVQDESR